MEKEAFAKKVSDLKKQIRELKQDFVTSNCKFKVNDTVQNGEQRGIITYIEVDSYGDFRGKWRKIKKNGEPYSYPTTWYSFDYNSMELVTENK